MSGDEKKLKYGTVIDHGSFNQILEMDDEGSHEFSQTIVFDFFKQAKETFAKMEKSIKEKDLPDLHELGHFLKGSSATIGLIKVKDHCEKIQHLGQMKDETGNKTVTDEEVNLKKIKDTLPVLKKDFEEAENALRAYYGEE